MGSSESSTQLPSLRHFKIERVAHPKLGENRLWSLTFDLQGEKANKFSKEVMAEFDLLMPWLEAQGSEIDALLLMSAKPGIFIAGADIEMVQAIQTAQEAEQLSRHGQQVLDRWEDLPFPTVAVVNGAAMGGGMEMSLGSSAIVVSNDATAKLGLPEVLLGILPGMGGCVRLPRKVGLANALDLILTGKTLNGERAYRMGLVEAVLPKEGFQESAIAWTIQNLKSLRSGVRLAKEPKLGGVGGAAGVLLEKTPMGRAFVLKKAREGVLSKTHGNYPAPLEVIEIMRSTGAGYGERLRGKSRESAMEREALGFGRCAATQVSKNLIRLFFLTETVKKSKGLPPGVSAEVRPVRAGGVLGAGVMGGGIAQLLADRGVPARMKDVTGQALATGIQAATKLFQKDTKRKKITARQAVQKLGLISPTLDYAGFHSLDLVVEAIVENMEIKKKVLQELETKVRPDCIIASNTSSLSITEMQKVLKSPERFVGMHFFNPVAKMPLIEVIRGATTSDAAVTTTFQFCKQLGKTPIVVKDAPGFLVNRLLAPYLNEATYLLSDGVPIYEIDRVLGGFGMPMGAMELVDEIGVDVGEKVAHILYDAFGARMLPSPHNAKIVAAKRLGKKNGLGLYRWEEKGRKKVLDPEVYSILGVTPKKGAVADEEILERCLLPMINEASRCLDESIVATPSEVDLGMIMGTGFPPFRGGLLRYADSLGIRKVKERLEHHQKRFGARFEPAPGILKRAEHDQKFYPA